MSAPLRDDDSAARAELEADSVEAEKRYAIERHERLQDFHDFASAGGPPSRTCRAKNDDPGLDIPSSGDSRVPAKRARVTSLLHRIFAPGPSRSTTPEDANGGAGGRNLGQAGPATTSTSLTEQSR